MLASEHIISISQANAIIIRLIIAILAKYIIKTAFSRASTYDGRCCCRLQCFVPIANTRTNWCRVIGNQTNARRKEKFLSLKNVQLKPKHMHSGVCAAERNRLKEDERAQNNTK